MYKTEHICNKNKAYQSAFRAYSYVMTMLLLRWTQVAYAATNTCPVNRQHRRRVAWWEATLRPKGATPFPERAPRHACPTTKPTKSKIRVPVYWYGASLFSVLERVRMCKFTLAQ